METDGPGGARQPVRVAVLGSTGSIGTQALDVIAAHPDRFTVTGLAAGRSESVLQQQVDRFKPVIWGLTDAFIPGGITGKDALSRIAAHPEVDLVLVAVTGAAGWEPTLAAIRAGKLIALANKEALVVAGSVIVSEARRHHTALRPVDSEHSAIWQCLQGEGVSESYLARPQGVRRMLLTASGGPFRNAAARDLETVTPAQALAHPTWRMGAKVTVDSATLMNKGLEVIEAHWLFDMPYDQLQVVIHPQSVVHSMVEFNDGSVKAQLGMPDMRVPIQYALAFPEHIEHPTLPSVDWAAGLALEFLPPDLDRFPCLRLAIWAGRQGATYPAVLSAADEVAVAAFLGERITFTQVPALIDDLLGQHDAVQTPDLDDLRMVDSHTRAAAEEWISRGRRLVTV